MAISRRTLLRAGTAGAALTIGGLPTAASAQTGGRPPNVRVGFDGFAAHAEPAVAANPRDPANLIAACMAGDLDDPGNIAVYASFDGGRCWSGNGALPLPAGTASADDVTVTFSPDGVGFVAAMATSGLSRDDRGVYHWRTDDGGRTFQPPTTVVSGVFVDHPTLSAETGLGVRAGAAAPARLYATWVAEDHAGVGFTRSLDGGLTFEPARTLQNANNVSLTRSASGPDGLVCAVYGADPVPNGSGGDLAFAVQAVASSDGGATFGAAADLGFTDATIHLPGGVIAGSGPSAAIDPRGGAVYVAFTTYQPGAEHSGIAVRASFDAGATWSPPVTATPADAVVYFQPQLAVDQRGRVWLSALALSGGLVDVVLFGSAPGPLAFGPPSTVTSEPFDPSVAHDGNPKHGAWWIGDYQGLTATPYGVHPLWNDTRTGQLELYTARVS